MAHTCMSDVVHDFPVHPSSTPWHAVVLACRLQQGRLKATIKQAIAADRARRRSRLAESLLGKGVPKRAYDLLRAQPSQRLHVVADGASFAVDAERIDEIARRAWGTIYAGGLEGLDAVSYTHLTLPTICSV
eukprot:2195605-Alexandrium_andersonii.AAC.1